MAGIYIHIPFCKQACHYCNFHFSTSMRNKAPLLAALNKELEVEKEYLKGKTLNTIYFGGGTPSLLTEAELAEIMNTIVKNYSLSEDLEITLEANPDDLSKKKLDSLVQSPINRLSIGVQSFQQADLVFMNRAHNSEEAKNSIRYALDAGFDNMSVDLIYGTPTLSNEDWKTNIKTLTDLGIGHISSYALTVEENTALWHFIKKGKMEAVDDQKASEQFEILIEDLEAAGYEHYEISNFSKPGAHSKHNTAYWFGKWYLGVGPGAHSFNGTSRSWNISNNAKYIQQAADGFRQKEVEMLSKADQFNEYVLTRMRTKWGCEKQFLLAQCSDKHLQLHWGNYLNAGLIREENGHYLLSKKGKHLADRIASDLFI